MDNLTSNTSTRVTLEEEEWSEYQSIGIPFTVYLISLFLFGTIGNSMTLFVYSKKAPSNCRTFVLWLAVLDLLSCVVGIPEYVYRERHTYTYTNDALCRAFVFIHFFLSCYSVLILNLIAVERYLKTCKMFDRQMSGKQAKWACVCLALTSVPFAVYPSNWIYGITPIQGNVSGLIGHRCAIPGITKGQIFFGIFGFFTVFCLIFCAIFYALVHRMLIRHKNENTRILRLAALPTVSETKIQSVEYENSTQKVSNNGKFEKGSYHCNMQENDGKPSMQARDITSDLNSEDKMHLDFHESSTQKHKEGNDSLRNVYTSNEKGDSGKIIDESESLNSQCNHQDLVDISSSHQSDSNSSLNRTTDICSRKHTQSNTLTSSEGKHGTNYDAISNKIAQQSKQLSDHRSKTNIRSVSKYSLVSTSEAMLHQVTHTIEKSVKMTSIFFVASALSYISAIPYTTFMCIASIHLNTYYGAMEKLGSFGHFFLYFHLLNYVINPVVYCCMDKEFRRELKRVCCCWRKMKE